MQLLRLVPLMTLRFALCGVGFADRLRKLHGARADEVTKALEDAVLKHVGDAPLADDVTLVVVSRNAAN